MKCVFHSLDEQSGSLSCYHDNGSDPVPENAHEIDGMLGESVFQRDLIVDLSNVEMIVSEEIGWLLKCHRRANEQGGKFVLHSLSSFAWNTLKMMKLNEIFQIEATAADAERTVAGD